MEEFQNISSRPLFTIKPEMLKFHPYSTRETMVGFVIYCVFKENSSLKVKVIYPKYYECWKCWLQFVLEKGLKIFIFVSWNGWFSEWNYWFWITVPEQMVEKPPQFWTLVVLKIERLLNICCLSYPFDLLHYNRYLEKMN